MQVNNVNQQTNFGAGFAKVKNLWRQAGDFNIVPEGDVYRALTSDPMDGVGIVLVSNDRDTLEVLGNPSVDGNLTDALMVLTGDEAKGFNQLLARAQENLMDFIGKQRQFLGSLFGADDTLMEKTTIVSMKPCDFFPRLSDK